MIITVLELPIGFLFYVFFKKDLVADSSTLESALEWLFALYYTSNMYYPKECQMTLEFLQRYLLIINMEYSRSQKQPTDAARARILTLIEKVDAVSQDQLAVE